MIYILIVPVLVLIAYIIGVVFYAGILIVRHPIEGLYDEISGGEYFIHIESVPKKLKYYIIQIEDKNFYKHKGYDSNAIRIAISTNLREKSPVLGGSTISQQLVKNLYLRFNKSYTRKIAELLIAIYVEKKLSKDDILSLYINTVYFGNGIYGITHCAKFYFNKTVDALSINQMFMVSCMLFAPTKGNPISYPDVFERLRDKKLNRLIKNARIDKREYEEIKSHHADNLDEDLRCNDNYMDGLSQDIPLCNYRFGIYRDYSKVTIP